jgi:iron complex transport system substrate-binding protein
VTDYCNYPPEALKKPKVGGFSTVNIEKVLSLNPDLVVAAYGNGAETVETLRNYGITVIALNPRNLTDVMKNIEMLGKVTGVEKNATKLVNMMKQKIREVEKVAANSSYRPKVAHILWHDPIWVSGSNTFVDELIRIAGGTNAFGDLEGWKIVSIEDLLARNPDIIIVNSGTGMGGKNNILYDWAMRELKDVKAVKEGKVYVIDSDIISRPSYRLVYALEEIARIINQSGAQARK